MCLTDHISFHLLKMDEHELDAAFRITTDRQERAAVLQVGKAALGSTLSAPAVVMKSNARVVSFIFIFIFIFVFTLHKGETEGTTLPQCEWDNVAFSPPDIRIKTELRRWDFAKACT